MLLTLNLKTKQKIKDKQTMPTTSHYFFEGTCKWAKVRKPDDYDKFTIDLYPTEESLTLFRESNIAVGVRTDEDGDYLRFNRPRIKMIKDEEVDFGPPKVTDIDGFELEGLIGNGSKVIVKVSEFGPYNGRYGHRLEEVRVMDLVVYEGSNEVEAIAPDSVKPW